VTDRVAVVGAGISGLATAVALLDEAASTGRDVDVTVFDGEGRTGGRIATSPFAGVPHVDEGADAFLARVPEAVSLAHRVGLGEDLVHPESVGAAVWRDGLHPIPDGLLLGVPGRVGPIARSSLLSWRGKLRAAMEPLLPRTSLDDDSVGTFVRSRFGDEVHEYLVDSLVGSIYASDTDRFSLAEVPQLAALAASDRSMLLAARRRRATPGTATAASSPVFAAPRDGMFALVAATAATVTACGGTVQLGARVDRVEHGPNGGWVVQCGTSSHEVDAVVLATPAHAAASVLADTAPQAATLLDRAETADVIMVTLHLGADEWPDRLRGLSGYLVPKPVQRHVTAASFASQKWAHWRPPDGGEILRVSLGRDGMPVLHLTDAEVVERVLENLLLHLGLAVAPLDVRITRWPGAFAQYRPHHRRWVGEVERSLPEGITVTGAGFGGIGIPACVRSGTAAATRATTHLDRLAGSDP
jgi:oxygen-dependent protoporphyrinogen oxidase